VVLCIPLATWSHGATLVLMESFDAGLALHLMERERITVWNAVDAMAIAVLEHPISSGATDRRSGPEASA
jgi:hypothetical protein